jgi:hypothetical protein
MIHIRIRISTKMSRILAMDAISKSINQINQLMNLFCSVLLEEGDTLGDPAGVDTDCSACEARILHPHGLHTSTVNRSCCMNYDKLKMETLKIRLKLISRLARFSEAFL